MTLPWATWRSAFAGRMNRLLGRRQDPYSDIPAGVSLSPHGGLKAAMMQLRPTRTYPREGDAAAMVAWQGQARRTLATLCGYQEARQIPSLTHSQPAVAMGDGLSRQTVYLRVREETDVPVTVLVREDLGEDAQILLYLAGSTSGVHVGWGEARVPIDHARIQDGADLARQAALKGYRVICIEQMGFGFREERILGKPSRDRTIDAHNHALLIGQCLTGLKAMDVSAVVDWCRQSRPRVRIWLFGHSSGGTNAVYAAALDPRIEGVLASGSVGPVVQTVGSRANSSGDGIVPGLLKYFEMSDLIALIAPRPFVALSGVDDHIYPFSGAAAVVEGARPAYRALGAAEAIQAAAAPGPHRYYARETWDAWRRWIDPTLDA